jgi:catechol 2,3-dioxygenase-like lactoylglutathione lyase family enzyme
MTNITNTTKTAVKPLFVGLVVADMAKSLAFYRRLGLEIPAEADAEGHVQIELAGGFLLVWDTVEIVRSFDPDWTAPQGDARAGFGFECTGAADVDRLYAELVDAGYAGHKKPWDAFWGQRYAVVRDPDGNDVGLLATL